MLPCNVKTMRPSAFNSLAMRTAALIMTTAGVYDRRARRFLDIDGVVAALGHAANPRPLTQAERIFMTSHQGLRGLAKGVD